jgi:hypothetical protein
MATLYTVQISDGSTTGTLIIEDSLNPLPGSDTWRTDQPEVFGVANGAVASWGTDDTKLHGLGAVPILILEGFRKSTNVNDRGTGEKLLDEGTMQQGTVSWRCTAKS